MIFFGNCENCRRASAGGASLADVRVTHRGEVVVPPVPRRRPQLRVAREDSGGVQLRRERHDVVEHHRAVRGAVAEHAVDSSRPAHGPAGVAPDSEVEPRVRGDGGTRPGRRTAPVLVPVPARVVRRVEVDPVVRRGLPVRKLRRLRLSDEHHPAIEEALNGGRGTVLLRVELEERAVAAAGAEPLDVVDVLHREAHASERLLRRRREVEAGWHANRLRRATGDARGKDLVAAIAIGNRAVEEGLVLVVVQTESWWNPGDESTSTAVWMRMGVPSKMFPVEGSKKYGPEGSVFVRLTPRGYFLDNRTKSTPNFFCAEPRETLGKRRVPL